MLFCDKSIGMRFLPSDASVRRPAILLTGCFASHAASVAGRNPAGATFDVAGADVRSATTGRNPVGAVNSNSGAAKTTSSLKPQACSRKPQAYGMGVASLRDAGDSGMQLVSTERCIPTGCFASHAAYSLKPKASSLELRKNLLELSIHVTQIAIFGNLG